MKIPREVVLKREKEVWDLRQKCWTQTRIAQELSISQPGVTKILKRLTERYKKEFSSDIDRIKTEQVMQLEHVANEAMDAWENTKNRIAIDESGNITVKLDPRYLDAVMKAKGDIRKILGVEAPQKTEHTGKDGKPIEHDVQQIVTIYIPENGRDAGN